MSHPELTDDQYALLVYLRDQSEIDDEEYYPVSRPLWDIADQLDVLGFIESTPINNKFRITESGKGALKR